MKCQSCNGVGILGYEPNTEHEIVCEDCDGTGEVTSR